MATVIEQIQNSNQVICQNIQLLSDQRGLLSGNILSQLRNLVEGVAVRLYSGASNSDFKYDRIEPALAFVRKTADYHFLGKFHKLIQKSASHYTLDGDDSERLMLKYYEYLLRMRSVLQDHCSISILANLESFPVNLDPSLQEYHEKIAARIEATRLTPPPISHKDRYYIHKTRPFFMGTRIYYEVTFYKANDSINKSDRIIAFTNIDITDNYAALLELQMDAIQVLGQIMPITIIRKWDVSIRPCEIDNFARILGITTQTRTTTTEYQHLMKMLTADPHGLFDLVGMTDDEYANTRAEHISDTGNPQIFRMLDEVRRIVVAAEPGHNVLRYLMLRMHNTTLKKQYAVERCSRLSNLKLDYGCIPFDDMPFCSALREHKPRYRDLIECLSLSGRNHELLARRVKNNVEQNGILYTPQEELTAFGDINQLISKYNSIIYHKHAERQLAFEKGHIFIRGYENDTASIIEKIKERTTSGIAGYAQAVERWLNETRLNIDDQTKKDALKELFSQSRVALIYGAAGTGKSTMANLIANYFNDKAKLFLAYTNPAIANLKRKIVAQNSTFRTISSQIHKQRSDPEYDLLVIDECSIVSNKDLIRVLNRTSFKLLVLIGDIYQIESIEFGNWFRIIRSFIPRTSVFELKTPFRTKDESLITFWNKVRNIDDDLAEVIAKDGYSTTLDNSLFRNEADDEIILCLNYDGLYGINNINRFLQSSNKNKGATWQISTYKVGDPVLFSETERFHPVIYNNLKGRIVAIEQYPERIQFDISLDRPLSQFDVADTELQWIRDSIVRFSVFDCPPSDDDSGPLNTIVPFQVAYAVSIHKAQGLEYDSVKIAITESNNEDITHSIFYTAVTRTRKHLKIFWTPETQQSVLKKLCRSESSRDVAILKHRRRL